MRPSLSDCVFSALSNTVFCHSTDILVKLIPPKILLLEFIWNDTTCGGGVGGGRVRKLRDNVLFIFVGDNISQGM